MYEMCSRNVRLSLYNTKGNKHHIGIVDTLFDYQQPHQHVHLNGKKRYYSVSSNIYKTCI